MTRKYIVAHNRDRDFYQVAAAVAEEGALDCLVTDYYAGESGGWIPRLRGRYSSLVPAEKTRGIWSAVALQTLRGPLDRMGLDTIHQVNRRIGRKVRSLARSRTETDLLLYSTYAREAFIDPALADREKTLFMFHPHPTLIKEILEQDVLSWGVGQAGLQEETRVSHRVAVLDAELEHSDKVICASELTKRSVVRAGVEEDRVHVVPYGIAKPMPQYEELRDPAQLRFLFVGQAIHRKGIHHLLAAWRSQRPDNAELVLVCSRAQDGLLDDLPPNVTVKSGLSSADLWAEYCRAHCFVLPALLEGFGLVLLEAISAGCYLIYSDNTGFAGLDLPDTVGQEFPAGDVGELQAAMGRVGEMFSDRSINHDAIREASSAFSAERFREAIRECLQM